MSSWARIASKMDNNGYASNEQMFNERDNKFRTKNEKKNNMWAKIAGKNNDKLKSEQNKCNKCGSLYDGGNRLFHSRGLCLANKKRTHECDSCGANYTDKDIKKHRGGACIPKYYCINCGAKHNEYDAEYHMQGQCTMYLSDDECGY